MSNRTVVMDHTPIEQINLGNAPVAVALRNFVFRDGASLRVSRDVYNRGTEADRELTSADLHATPLGLVDRHYERSLAKYQCSKRLDNFPAAFRSTAAIAHYLKKNGHNVELMTTKGAPLDVPEIPEIPAFARLISSCFGLSAVETSYST